MIQEYKLEFRFPAHKCGLYLEHNAHRTVRSKLQDFIEEEEGLEDRFESPESKRRSIDTDELWTLQWYPETSIGFCKIAAPTLEEVLRRANAADS
jgi:hypothetical protein